MVGVIFAPVAGAAFGLVFGTGFGGECGFPVEDWVDLSTRLEVGLADAAATALAIGTASTAGPYFLMAQTYLTVRRRLPRDLMTFLQDAQEHRGVLRRVGPIYQFRYNELQRHLGGQQPLRQSPGGLSTGRLRHLPSVWRTVPLRICAVELSADIVRRHVDHGMASAFHSPGSRRGHARRRRSYGSSVSCSLTSTSGWASGVCRRASRFWSARRASTSVAAPVDIIECWLAPPPQCVTASRSSPPRKRCPRATGPIPG